MPPTPFILYTNKDQKGWTRYIPEEYCLDEENSDLVRMTLETLQSKCEKGNRKLCVISPFLSLAVTKPDHQDVPTGIKLLEGQFLAHTNQKDKTHESIALAPSGDTHLQMILQSKKRNQDNHVSTTDWQSRLDFIHKLSLSSITGEKTVKAILDHGPIPDGHCYEIVFDWDENPESEIYEHVRKLSKLCGV